jgi:hypothetical protein
MLADFALAPRQANGGERLRTCLNTSEGRVFVTPVDFLGDITRRGSAYGGPGSAGLPVFGGLCTDRVVTPTTSPPESVAVVATTR